MIVEAHYWNEYGEVPLGICAECDIGLVVEAWQSNLDRFVVSSDGPRRHDRVLGLRWYAAVEARSDFGRL